MQSYYETNVEKILVTQYLKFQSSYLGEPMSYFK